MTNIEKFKELIAFRILSEPADTHIAFCRLKNCALGSYLVYSGGVYCIMNYNFSSKLDESESLSDMLSAIDDVLITQGEIDSYLEKYSANFIYGISRLKTMVAQDLLLIYEG